MVQLSALVRWFLVIVLGEGGSSSSTVHVPDQVNVGEQSTTNAILWPVLRLCVTNEDLRNATEGHAQSPCARNSTLYLRIDAEESNVVAKRENNATNVTATGTGPDTTAYFLLTTNNSSSENVLLLQLIREMVAATWRFALRAETVRAFEFAGDGSRSSPSVKHDPADEILVVGDGSYMSVSNYRSSVLPILVGEPVARLPCPSGLRMPNSTDCSKYYVCNATRGQLFTFACPYGMAFNAVKRICDVESAKDCDRNVSAAEAASVADNVVVDAQTTCSKNGKIADPESPRNYYVCVSSHPSGPFRKIKFSCPEGLVFCNKAKVCKAAILCSDYVKNY